MKQISPSPIEYLEFSSSSADDSQAVAKTIAPFFRSGDVLCIEGRLGAGKTCFTQGLALGLGISEAVTSPSFPIIQEYQGDLPLYHMDLYRLNSSDEVIETGAQELFFGDGLCVIEWPDRAQDLLPETSFHLDIDICDDQRRIFRLRGPVERIEEIRLGIS